MAAHLEPAHASLMDLFEFMIGNTDYSFIALPVNKPCCHNAVLLPVGGDLMYLETIWVNSLQNDLPQRKLFAVRYHDRIPSGTTLADAILKRNLFSDSPQDPWAPPSRLSATARQGSESREERERGDQRRDGDGNTNPNELAQRDVNAKPAARLEPDQAGQRSDRQQARAQVAAD